MHFGHFPEIFEPRSQFDLKTSKKNDQKRQCFEFFVARNIQTLYVSPQYPTVLPKTIFIANGQKFMILSKKTYLPPPKKKSPGIWPGEGA
jgi:hypothetical protein